MTDTPPVLRPFRTRTGARSDALSAVVSSLRSGRPVHVAARRAEDAEAFMAEVRSVLDDLGIDGDGLPWQVTRMVPRQDI